MKREVCSVCEARESEGGESSFYLRYKGLHFNGETFSDECLSCATERHMRMFDRLSPGFIEVKPAPYNTPIVNWHKYQEEERSYNGGESSSMLHLLIVLGVLQFGTSGDVWMISDGAISLLPSTGFGSKLYFRSRSQIENYGRQLFGNTLYPWSIYHITETYSKSEVMKRGEENVSAINS